jgi:hypothetical protein
MNRDTHLDPARGIGNYVKGKVTNILFTGRENIKRWEASFVGADRSWRDLPNAENWQPFLSAPAVGHGCNYLRFPFPWRDDDRHRVGEQNLNIPPSVVQSRG